jgi:hypothetical protein
MGLNARFAFSKNATVIVAQREDRLIRALASDYEIPIVSLPWVLELMRTAALPDPKYHLLVENTRMTLGEYVAQAIRDQDLISSPIERTSHESSVILSLVRQ